MNLRKLVLGGIAGLVLATGCSKTTKNDYRCFSLGEDMYGNPMLEVSKDGRDIAYTMVELPKDPKRPGIKRRRFELFVDQKLSLDESRAMVQCSRLNDQGELRPNLFRIRYYEE